MEKLAGTKIANNYSELRKVLMDEESLKIFDARVVYMENKNTFAFIENMLNLYGKFEYPELDNFLEGKGEVPLVIFGAGYEGGIAAEILKHTKYASYILCFCDNKRELWGKEKQGLPIISVYELLVRKQEVVYILASSVYNHQFLLQLLNLGVFQNNIFIPRWGGYLYAQRGWQYFDVFQANEHEVFLDAGAYDGMTSRDFLQWCHGQYDGIYMFEINAEMKDICFANLGTDHNVSFRPKGVWNKDTYMKYHEAQSSTCLEEVVYNSNDNNVVQVCSIDSELGDENITFIKMDVEGSELEALEGAKNIIKNLKPRLAISVYHKLDDIVNIMSYLIDLNPKYKFYLRHYWACQCETVLYAT